MDKKILKQDNLNQQMERIKTEDYSVDDYNELVNEVHSLETIEEGEDLPFRVSRFCQEYVIWYNEEKAAQKAGYSLWNAGAAGSRLLSNPKVRREIERLQKQISVKLQITQERVLTEYAKLAYSNVKDLYNEDNSLKNLSEMDRDTAAVISGLSIGVKTVKDKDGNEKLESYIKELKTVDKKSALDALAKHLGMFEQDNDRKIPVDLKTLISMFPKEVQDSIKVGLARRIGNK
ncbi:MAG TPA: hypothetical protein DDW90_08150 [Cyanobacteria bacterium UBA9971]|nr:hypothetical protein [Cyanobacteria bacterium UBA9971]HCR36150.1 hypothetical protein [Candidatus Woesebacteria bacterium]